MWTVISLVYLKMLHLYTINWVLPLTFASHKFLPELNFQGPESKSSLIALVLNMQGAGRDVSSFTNRCWTTSSKRSGPLQNCPWTFDLFAKDTESMHKALLFCTILGTPRWLTLSYLSVKDTNHFGFSIPRIKSTEHSTETHLPSLALCRLFPLSL